MPSKLLIIRHGALGDFFQSFGSFASIRAAYPAAHITLLTGTPYQAVAAQSGWFDHIVIDDRPPLTHWHHNRRIRRLLREMNIVFDLQNSGRTARYLRYAGRGVAWSGQHSKASLPHDNPHARQMHGLMRQGMQLRAANITVLPRTIPAFLADQGPRLSTPYIVLVPGAAAHRPAKCWPVTHFAELARHLAHWGFVPVIVGSKTESARAHHIQQAVPTALDLTGQTDLPALAGLLHRALLSIGNDTGPMHMAAAMDCPTLTFFSHESDPRRCAPHALTAGYSRTMACHNLADLPVKRVKCLLKDWGMPLIKARLAPNQQQIPAFSPIDTD